MCGIAGMFTNRVSGFTLAEAEIFKTLFIASQVRGLDGAGVFYVGDKQSGFSFKKRPKSYWVKIGSSASHLLANEAWNAPDTDLLRCKAAVAHCRAATRGTIDTPNAHPFVYKSILLVHNGSLKGISNSDHYGKCAVDSEAIAKELGDAEAHEAESVLKRLDGAAALVWYDERDNKLKMWRNHERPMSMVRAGNTWYFASEALMLEWCLRRANIHQGFSSTLPVHTVLTWDISANEVPSSKCTYTWPVAGDNTGPKVVNGDSTSTSPKTTQMRNPILTTADTNKKSKGPTKYHATEEYFGLCRKDRIIIDPTGLVPLAGVESEKPTHLLIGKYVTHVEKSPPAAIGMLKDIMFRCTLKPSQDVHELFNERYLTGTAASILINSDDMTDVITYVIDIEPLDTNACNAIDVARGATNASNQSKGH